MRVADRIVALILLGCLNTPVFAAPLQLGDVRIEVPQGWTHIVRDGGGVMLEREFAATDDASEGKALIEISAPVAGPSEQLAANLASLASVVPGLEDEDPFSEGTGTTALGYDIAVEFRCCVYPQDVSVAKAGVALGSDGQQAYLHLVMLNMDDEPQDEAEADFASVVRSFRFSAEDQAAGPDPKAGAGGLDGVFTHLATGLMPNVFGGVDFTSESEIVLFDPKGLFSTTLPRTGQPLAEHCAASPTDCGTYAVSGGGWFTGAAQISMSRVVDDYGRIETESSPLTKQGEDMSIGDDSYTRVPPLEDGTRFDGEWRYFFASSGSGATSSGSVAVEQTLTLRSDGRFERTGFAGGSSSVDTGSGTTGVTATGDQAGSDGTYEIDGYTLTLTGRDGRSESLSIFAPEVGSEELLVIDGDNYLKQDA